MHLFFSVVDECRMSAKNTFWCKHGSPLTCKIANWRRFNGVGVKPGEARRIPVHNPHYR